MRLTPQHAVEIVLGEIEEIRRVDDAGVVDQDVDLAEAVDGGSDEIVHVETLADVGALEAHLAELCKVGFGDDALVLVDVGDHHPSALAEKRSATA